MSALEPHQKHLLSLPESRCFERYITFQLAGDFCFAISNLLKAKDAEIDRLKRGIMEHARDYRYTTLREAATEKLHGLVIDG